MDVRCTRTTAPACRAGANHPFPSALDYARNVYAASDRRMPEGRALAIWLGQTASALGLAEAAVPDVEALHRTRRGSISLRVRKVWRQLRRESVDVARCTVARLMQSMGLQGVIRGKPVRTTISEKAGPCPPDHVNRQFQAARPSALRVSEQEFEKALAAHATTPDHGSRPLRRVGRRAGVASVAQRPRLAKPR